MIVDQSGPGERPKARCSYRRRNSGVPAPGRVVQGGKFAQFVLDIIHASASPLLAVLRQPE